MDIFFENTACFLSQKRCPWTQKFSEKLSLGMLPASVGVSRQSLAPLSHPHHAIHCTAQDEIDHECRYRKSKSFTAGAWPFFPSALESARSSAPS
ncbi:hypothetical protein DO71_3861 [Burkholderia pseudomallei]|nr:hypothetical protein DO71_3861 [Burkholderia pseudomallei]